MDINPGTQKAKSLIALAEADERLTQREVATNINAPYASTPLAELWSDDYVSRVGGGGPNDSYRYALTDKGKDAAEALGGPEVGSQPDNDNKLPFEVGRTYHRVEDIHEKFGGNRYSGISPCAEYPHVFIFFGESGDWHGYDDEFTDDGRFLYTGEGRDGDMTMDGGNIAIRNHKPKGNELHVFEIEEGAWQVTYVGQYEYQDHHRTTLPDRNDNMREAIRFELVPVGGLEMDVDAQDLDDISIRELREKAAASVSGESNTTSESRSRTTYRRSEVVKKYALRAADGICQGCGEEAPFVDTNGEPFLEVHHLYRRSDGGADHPDNVIALCPNCHRRVHQGQDGDEFNSQLIEKKSGR